MTLCARILHIELDMRETSFIDLALTIYMFYQRNAYHAVFWSRIVTAAK